jgi:hypothetical protein
MKNPLKPDHGDRDHDNPVVPNAVERPVERAADRAAMHDNPIVPNAIERPVERAAGGDPDAVFHRPGIVDRPGINDGPGDRPGMNDSPSDIARGRAAGAPVMDRPIVNEGAGHTNLFPDEELAGYRTQWEAIQTGFVDQPRDAVAQADALVSQLVTRLTDVFTRERSTLEGQWAKGDNVSTEDLRVALTRYRSFFHRLLSM